jgi:hypothetical protein
MPFPGLAPWALLCRAFSARAGSPLSLTRMPERAAQKVDQISRCPMSLHSVSPFQQPRPLRCSKHQGNSFCVLFLHNHHIHLTYNDIWRYIKFEFLRRRAPWEMLAGTAKPFRVAPPEAAVYPNAKLPGCITIHRSSPGK